MSRPYARQCDQELPRPGGAPPVRRRDVQTAAGERAGTVPPRATVVCHTCVQPVTIHGDTKWGKAVNTHTDRELGAAGHLVAPIDADIVRAAMARQAGARS